MNDNDRVIPPDTNGAVGPNHTMTVTNSYIRVHSKSTGAAALTLPEDNTFGDTNGFWSSVLPVGSTGVFAPRVVYDPFAGRWIFTAASDGESGSSSVCVATSQSSDPSGTWNLFRFDVDSSDALWADFPMLGFNKDWIFISVNMHTVSNDSFSRGQVYAFNKANLNAGSSAGTFVFTDSTIPFGLQPAVTLDNNLGTEFLIRHANSAAGTEKKSTITGAAPAAPTLTIDTATITSTLGGWSVPSGEFLPQACTSPACTGTARQIDVGDSRVLNAVVRTVGGNTSLWFAQNITLPAGGSPTHAAAQWWQVDASSGSSTNVIQQGRIEDSSATQTNGGNHFAYPSIAVNKNTDVLIGYTRFSSSASPSAAYSFRAGTDTGGTLRAGVTLQPGVGYYEKTFGGSVNRWGDYSTTVVDPANDVNMWTEQEYADAPVGTGDGSGRWATWWGALAFVTPTSVSSVSGSGVYNGTATLTATLTADGSGLSGKTVSFTLNNTSVGNATTDSNGVATLTNVSLSGINAGTYSNAIGANFAGDMSYSSSSGTGSLSVSKATAGVNLGGLSQIYDGAAKSATATTTPANLNISFGYSLNGQAVQSPINAGTYTVTATVNDNNYQGAAAGTFIINKAGSTTTVSVSNAAYDGQTHGGTAAATGAGGLSQSLTVTYSGRNMTAYGPSTTAPTNAGDYTASASFGGDINHTASSDSQSYSISKANQTITVGTHAPSVATYNKSFTVAAGAGSGLPVTYGSSGACTNVGATFTMTGAAGTCTVSYDQPGNGNYNGAPQVTETVMARKADQSITFNPLVDKTFGDADFSVGATSSSGLSVSFAASGQCTVTGSTVHLTGAGGCTVIASQSGDSNYNAAANVQQSFSISKLSQTITFGALADKTFGDSDFSVTAAASSGLPISFSASGVCTVGGGTVHIVGAGGCTIIASQGGDTNHNAAADVAQSFQVAKAATATSLSSSTNPAPFGQGVTFTATVTSGAGTPTGAVQFKSDGVSVGAPVVLNAGGVATLTTPDLAAGVHTVTAEYGGDTNFSASAGALYGGQTVGGVLELSRPTYTVSERDGSVTVSVKRIGDTTQMVSVGYFTNDSSDPSVPIPCSTATGLALERCDYTRAEGTLQFAAGETEKSFVVLVNDDSYTEGPETLRLVLSNPGAGAALGTQSSSTLQINDDSPESSGNPIDSASSFVRQQYHDFLNREPDAPGLAFWTDQMTNCGNPNLEVCRINVSAAFFLSIEFKETGYLVERMYKVVYGDAVGVSTYPVSHTLPVPVVRLQEFLRDTQEIGRGVVIGQGDWQTQLEGNKNDFALAFVRRQRFKDAYPSSLTADQFVTRLDTGAGGVLSDTAKTQLNLLFGGPNVSSADETKRAQVLRQVAENPTLVQREQNRAFVLMQYFGYLRRNPDAAPDSDFTGYDFWLSKLSEFGGDFVRAEMVKAFISSDEYRRRFGQ
jgi:hypothetical protein